MRAFWDRLIRVNARQVFLVAFLLLAGAAIWSIVRAVAAPGTAASVPSLTEAERTWTPPAEAPVAEVATPAASAEVETQSSAFVSTTIDVYLARKEAERLAAERAAAEAAEKAAAEAAAAAVTPPAAPAIPLKISICYRGILQRMDGTTLALIETSDNGRRSFYREGETVAGVTLGAFGRQQVIVTPPVGTSVTVNVNESYTVSGE